MTESYTYAIHGWKILDRDKVKEISNELYDISENVYKQYDLLDGFIMCLNS